MGDRARSIGCPTSRGRNLSRAVVGRRTRAPCGRVVERRDPGTPECAALRQRPHGAVSLPPTRRRSRDRRSAMGGHPGVFLQHASDPISGGPQSAVLQPDWLVEPPAGIARPRCAGTPSSRSGSGADMTNAVGVPGGHGHNYGTWCSTVGGRGAADGWTPGTPSACGWRWRRRSLPRSEY